MPQMKFIDGEIKKLATPKATTWYSHPSVKGLRLCITRTGAKTWCVTKWDKAEQKNRNFTIVSVNQQRFSVIRNAARGS